MKPVSLVAVILFVAAFTGARACEMSGTSLQHPAPGEIDKTFGYYTHPILKTTRLHPGLDYRGAMGDPVVAAESGIVVQARREGGYGNYVRIDHGNGLHTAYAHLATIAVKVGDCVHKGTAVGTVGQTGIASSTHLHFELIENNRFVDPITRLPARS
jgi:murein DD-endopeptidase MepM/ murein hydrolase activator NlpD